ncbi:MAG: hypothetical protein ACJ780_30500 [Solirubrobacteraceae bacterium]
MSGIADTIGRAASAVEEFRGDYGELAAVMRASWVDSPGAPYLYTADLLADFLRYPGADLAPAPAIYADEGLVAFAAGLPRHVEVDGAMRRILISTFLTVASAQKTAGYGIVVWSELMRRAAAAGFDGVINYCAEGEAMHRMIETGCRLLDLPLMRVKSFSYLVGRLPPDRPDEEGYGERPSAHQLVDAAAGVAERCRGETGARLWRVWSVPEAEWQLSRLGSIAIGAGGAVLSGSVVTVADEARTRYLVIDDVLWGSVGDNGRRRLVGDLLAAASSEGASCIVLPAMGYQDVRPFLAAGLVPSPHTMHAYLSLWSDPSAVRPVHRYYLDVI